MYGAHFAAASLQQNGRIAGATTLNQVPDTATPDDFAVVAFETNELDVTPASITFESQSDVDRDSLVTSAPATVSDLGLAVSAPVWIDNGEYQINADGRTAAPGRVENGDEIAVRHTSDQTTTMLVGGYRAVKTPATPLGRPAEAAFSSTTRAVAGPSQYVPCCLRCCSRGCTRGA